MTTEQVYVNEHRVSKITGKALSTLRNDRHLGKGIPYVKDGKSIRYFLPEVYRYMDSRTIRTEAANG